MTIRVCMLGILLILLSQSGFSQSFQQDCTGATLDGSSMLPIDDMAVSGGVPATFTVEAACQLGATAFSDIVTCFTPTNNCTVELNCDTGGGSNLRASIHDGPCATNFTSCLAAGTDVAPPNDSTVSQALTSGQNYCFVCQNTVGNASFNATVNVTSGDCGALPVEVESFRIE